MTQIATGVQIPEDCIQRIIKVGKKSLPSIMTRGMEIDVNSAIMTEEDWRLPIISYLQYPTLPSEKKITIMALNYLMWNGDLIRNSKDELLSRCLGKEEYMKAKPVKSITSQEIITFIEEQIVHRFGIPESNTTDRRTSFISKEMQDMASRLKIKLLQSTPYYAQANGQAESSNKAIINIIRKMLEENPRQC
ncbi:unnamed protein product [Prunus brigantina]